MKRILNEKNTTNNNSVTNEKSYSNNDNINNKSNEYILPNEIDDNELYKRVRTFVSEYMTKTTIDELNNMYFSIFGNNHLKKENYSKGEKVFKNIYERLKLTLNDNIVKPTNFSNKKEQIKNYLEIFANGGYDDVEKAIKHINNDENDANSFNNELRTNESIELLNLGILVESNPISKKYKQIKNFLKNSDTKNDNQNDYGNNIINARLIILGYIGDKFNWGIIKEWGKKGFPPDDPIWKNKLNNPNNLLKYLSNKGWSLIEKTLQLPFEGQTDEEKRKSASKYVQHIMKTLEKYLFKCPIPSSIENLTTTVEKIIKNKIWNFQYSVNNFGKKVKSFMMDEIKKDYVEAVGNDLINGIKISKFIRNMDPKIFWKNVKVYNCYTEKSFDIINTAIKNVTSERDSTWKTSMKQLMTALNTKTYYYRIEYRDPLKMAEDNAENIESIFSGMDSNERAITGKKINKRTLAKYEKQIVKSIPKIYYIVVTEGLFKKGKLANKIKDKFADALPGSSSSGEKLRKYMGL